MRGIKFIILFLVLIPLFSVVESEGAVFIQCPCPPESPISPETGNIECTLLGPPMREIACKHLAAGDGMVKMADGTDSYIFSFKDVTGIPDDMVMEESMLGMELPAPTIKVKEGQEFYLTLTNVGMVLRPDLFDPHTIHWHGFPNAATVFDGEPMGSLSINMGSSLTYYYNVVEPGTYIYHCHVEVVEHLQMGMIGNLFVRPAQDGTEIEYPPGSGKTYTKFAYNDGDGSTGYDVDYPVIINSFDPVFHNASITVQPLPFANMHDTYPMLNGRGYPDTVNPDLILNVNGNPSQKVSSLITATKGDSILLRIASLSAIHYYSLSVLGIPMKVVGKGAKLLRGPTGNNLYVDTNSVILGGGESIDVILDTADVEPGIYFLYVTNLNHLSNGAEDFGGMMTEIVINP